MAVLTDILEWSADQQVSFKLDDLTIVFGTTARASRAMLAFFVRCATLVTVVTAFFRTYSPTVFNPRLLQRLITTQSGRTGQRRGKRAKTHQ